MTEISHSKNDCEENEDTYEKRMRFWNTLPEKLKKKILEQKARQLMKEGINPLTGLPVGMTQEEFDERNRQFRINNALAQSDGS